MQLMDMRRLGKFSDKLANLFFVLLETRLKGQSTFHQVASPQFFESVFRIALKCKRSLFLRRVFGEKLKISKLGDYGTAQLLACWPIS